MKKLLLIFLTGLFLVSCGHEEGMSQQEYKEMQYEQAFEKAFGKISPSQDWGFVIGTRTAMPNSNEWGTNNGLGYLEWPQPDPIGQQELADVLKVFNEKGKTSYQPLVNWENFFVQQVYTGPNGWKMNELASLVDYKVETTVICWYPYEVTTIRTTTAPYDDIINNFNAGNCTSNGGCMLMWNSATNDFSFKTSQSGGERIYGHWRMEKINGNYYVGFDHEAWRQAPANANEEDKRDYIYNDWIIKLIPGKPVEGDEIKETGRVICEDLGGIGDFDFNYVVFDATVYKSGKTIITLQAAGGTIPITVAGVNVHDAFGAGTKEMINTGDGPTRSPYTFEAASTYSRIIDIPIVVGGSANNMTQYILQAQIGKAPQKIKVPTTFRWCKEYKSISDAYPGFKNWVAGGEFWNDGCNQSLIY
jgi:hypothetical protein